MTQNNNSQNGPDNARDFEDVDVPTYNPGGASGSSRPEPRPATMSFDSAGKAHAAGTASSAAGAAESTETTETAAFSAADAPAYSAQPAAAAAPAPVTSAPTEILSDPSYDSEPTALEAKAAARKAKLEERKADPRRGTLDLGLLFVRLALSVYLIIAGVSTFFGLGGSEGLSGLEGEFGDYALPQVLSIVVPTLQLLAGVFLLLGLVTPFAAMVGLVVTGFTAIHELNVSGAGLDIFSWPEAVWLSLVLFLINIALQFTGPGVVSFDFSKSWARRPLASSWIFVVLGVAALVAAWWFGAGVNPL